MKTLTLVLGAVVGAAAWSGVPVSAVGDDKESDGWVRILDEKSFKDWKVAPGNPKWKVVEEEGVKRMVTGDPKNDGQWTFKDGVLHGEGGVSHIFSPRGNYENFAYKAEIKISDQGNSGQYFRAALGPGWPKGYEAQINSTHRDPKRTGTLYGFVDVKETLVPPDTWFTQEVIAQGNRIIIKVNGKTAVDFVDQKNSHTKGHFAFQQHNVGSDVWIKNVMVKELPASKKE